MEYRRKLFTLNHQKAETKMDREEPQIVDDLHDPLPAWYFEFEKKEKAYIETLEEKAIEAHEV